MKIYLAGGQGLATSEDLRQFVWEARVLNSYFYCSEDFKNGAATRYFLDHPGSVKGLFLDSGAFSASTKKVEIDIYKYITFIKRYSTAIEVYANLDVIVEHSGPMKDRSTSLTAKLSLENQKIMEQEGLHPIPVFHVGEPFDYLEYYVKHYEYIALGGAAEFSGRRLVSWLDVCFGRYFCDGQGHPKVKVHGFGVTSLPVLLRYPWYSVDSAAWAVNAGYGIIFVPLLNSGEWRYDLGQRVWVTPRGRQVVGGSQHFSSSPQTFKRMILRYLEERGFALGRSRFQKVDQSYSPREGERWAEPKPKDPHASRLLEIVEERGVVNDTATRQKVNIQFFLELQKYLSANPRPFRSGVGARITSLL